MNKHQLLFIFTSIICVVLPICHANAKSQPNVIVIMTDDQGNNLGYLGNPHLKTPNIDKLANESIRMTNFHTENKCTTTRASLLTGKDSFKTGAWRTSKGRSTLRSEEVTLAEVFKANGYKTGQFGKWHLGETWPHRPMDQGFDESVQLKTGGISQISDYWGNDYLDDTYYHNGKPQAYKGYCTDVFFNEAMRYIKEEKDKPLFVYLALNVAHVPFIVEDKYSQPYIDKGLDKKQAIFYGMIDNLDENFGRLDSFLTKEGLARDTIILFTTDDGASGASFIGKGKDDHVTKGWNMGMRGGKGSRFEGGHRVFANIKYPQTTLSGDNNTLTAVKDIYPTLLDMANIKAPQNVKLDGRSFKPYFTQPLSPSADDRPIYINYYNPKDFDNRKDASVIWQNWRLTSANELYDINKDFAQTNDVAKQHPELVEQLNAGYDAWDAIAKKHVREDVVRFILGDKKHPEITMTGQDYWTNKGCNPFHQGHAKSLSSCNGPLKVNFINQGKYEITLSRYPLYTDLSFSTNFDGRSDKPNNIKFLAETAKLTVGEKTVQTKIAPADTHVTFTMEIPKGEMDIQTWIAGKLQGRDKVAPAYFVTVKYLG
jgi:arylsulfatase A-like enzyme